MGKFYNLKQLKSDEIFSITIPLPKQKIQEKMTQWMQLAECKQTPGPIFTIHDYTKIAYPIDSGFCLREIITPNQKSNFIKREHRCDKIHALHSMPGNIISLESVCDENGNSSSWWVGFYNTSDNQYQQVRLLWSKGTIRQIKSVYNEEILAVLGCYYEEEHSESQNAHMEELIFINCQQKSIMAKGFLEGPTKQMTQGPNGTISIFSAAHKSITLYKNQYVQIGIGRIYKDDELSLETLMKGDSHNNSISLSNTRMRRQLTMGAHPNNSFSTISNHQIFAVEQHFWVGNQLIVWGNNRMSLVIQKKICQQFNDFHRMHSALPILCGFIVCDGSLLKIFKKKNINFEPLCEFNEELLMQASGIVLSPQEDIIAYYCPMTSSIIYSINFNEQIQLISDNKDKFTSRGQSLKISEIGHQKSFDYMVYGGQQGWFAAVNGSQIQLYNAENYQIFLSVKIEEEKKNQGINLGQEVKIRHLSIHPNRPIFAIALQKSIQIYYLSFNQAKLIKEIPLSLCGYLSFNTFGSMLTAIVSGKMGTKIFIYKISEIKNQFSLIQTLTIPQKIVSLQWDQFDTKLLCFHEKGYYQWSSDSRFKTKKQCSRKFNFKITGAIVTKQDDILIWGEHNLLKMPLQNSKQNQPNHMGHREKQKKQLQEQYTFGKISLMKVFCTHQYYYFILRDGRIIRNKTVDIQGGLPKALDFQTKNQLDISNRTTTMKDRVSSLSTQNKNREYPDFQIILVQGYKIIFISTQLNLKFYELQQKISKNLLNKYLSNIVGLERKKITQLLTKHKLYEEQIRDMKENMANVIADIKFEIEQEKKQKENQYKMELREHIDRQRKIKEEKIKLEEVMEKNIEIKEQQAMLQVKDLQKLYERKIALTTNKLLTEKQIGFRDKITAENRLKLLQIQHYENIEQIREQFAKYVHKNCQQQDSTNQQMIRMKKQYQSRLYDLEQENQMLLKSFQQKNQNSVMILKKNAIKWETMYNQCISEKDNIQKDLKDQRIQNQILQQQKQWVENKKIQKDRKCDQLSEEMLKIEKILEQKNKNMQCYERRIEDLQKSNQILKYRVLQLKQQNDPYEEEISQLKSNLTDLQEQHDRILKSYHENDQKLQNQKQQKLKYKEESENINAKYKKILKKYNEFVDKIRDITKFPIQQIRKELLGAVQKYGKPNNTYTVKLRSESPLGELNRIKDHLQVCLDEAVYTNKKNDEQKKIEVLKKNQQNSQLITEINTLRKKIREMEIEIKEKDLKINRLLRGDTPSAGYTSVNKQERATTEAASKQFRKTKGRQRETFYERSLFKTNNWNEKRLKTQQGSRRKKSSYSMVRDRSNHGHLAIHTTATEEVEDYKRIIEQKDLFIQKLIAKLHKT